MVGNQALWLVDRVDAFFDAIFSRWSFTAPLVDLVGLAERTVFARGVALLWELCADWLIALPLLGYQERAPADEIELAKALLRKRPTLRMVRPVAVLATGIAGARSVARLVQGSAQLALHSALLAQLLATAALLALILLLVPRAVLRSLEHADTARRRRSWFAAIVLAPLIAAAIGALVR